MTVPAVPRSSAIAPRVLFAIATVLVGAVTVAVVALDVLARDIDVPGDAFLDPGWLTAVAVASAMELQPDVVVMDVQMPGLDGIAATRRVTSDSPHTGVVVLTMSEDDNTVFEAMRAGALGYLLKGANQAEIVRAITAVSQGEAIFGASIARRVAEFFQPAGESAREPAFPQLTAREREILDLLAAGRSNGQIASTLFLSPKTVRNNVSNVFAKLHVADRAQAIVRAREAGLGRGTQPRPAQG